MTRFWVLLLILLGSTQASRWVLVWNDEFDHFDSNKWSFEIGNNHGWGNNELEYYTTSNHQINNGILRIQARKETIQEFHHTSTKITTQKKFSITYGKFEMRAKLPFGQGIWPAFWLLGDNITKVGWPACGEIDIMEYIGKEPTKVYGSVHTPGGDHTVAFTRSKGFSNDFHTFSVNWQPDFVEYYVDGQLYGKDTPSTIGHGKWVFNNNPMFIILNLAVGGNWPGNPDETTIFPQNFDIDYIRVYELDFSQEEQSE